MGTAMLDTPQVYERLKKVMDEPVARELADIISTAIEQSRLAVTKAEFNELRDVVRDLAEAQKRTEERVEQLAEAQKRTEERIEQLAEAQKRTEERVEQLAEAQKRTEERVDQLARQVSELSESVKSLAREVGGLSAMVGGDIEDVAYIVIHDVLKREFGWKVGVLQRTWQTWDKEPEEVNIFGQAFDPARPEVTIWIVGEAKHNITIKEVNRFIKQLERARRNLGGEIFPVCFCYRARPEVQELIRAHHINLVFSYGRLDRAST